MRDLTTICGRLAGWVRFGSGVVLAAWTGATASAADFRIESRVFVDAAPAPRTENVTLFHQGIVYDFGKAPKEVTILDAHENRSRFILLDPVKQRKTEIKLAEIEKFVTGLRSAALAAPAPFMQFLANPKFEEAFDPRSKELSLTSEWMEYKLTTVAAPSDEVAQEYFRFSDWYAKLNALTNVAAIPPFARIHVNSRLNQNKLVPVNVQLTLKRLGQKGKDLVLKSDHKVSWRLLNEDQQRILQADDMFAKFESVDAKTYFQADPADEGKEKPPATASGAKGQTR